MRQMRFRFQAYKDCKVCDGDGILITGMKAGFNVKNMEVTMEDDGHKCPECLERSEAEYDMYLDSQYERSREE